MDLVRLLSINSSRYINGCCFQQLSCLILHEFTSFDVIMLLTLYKCCNICTDFVSMPQFQFPLCSFSTLSLLGAGVLLSGHYLGHFHSLYIIIKGCPLDLLTVLSIYTGWIICIII